MEYVSYYVSFDQIGRATAAMTNGNFSDELRHIISVVCQ